MTKRTSKRNPELAEDVTCVELMQEICAPIDRSWLNRQQSWKDCGRKGGEGEIRTTIVKFLRIEAALAW